MKTMTCKQLGGPCDLALQANTADEIIKAQDKHLNDAVAGGDHSSRACAQGHEGTVEAPRFRNAVVQEGQS